MYKIFYPDIPNVGDLLNKDMLEDVFNITVSNTNIYKSNLTAIGSGLSARLIPQGMKGRLRFALERPFIESEHHIWGTGFLSYNATDAGFIYKNVAIHSLRGKLTQQRVEKIIGQKLDIPLADGGLLAERWLDHKIEKKYRMGIIPHYKEKDHSLIRQLSNYYNGSTVIDLGEEPRSVVRKIAQCELILSSSLHGLIIADSFHIPNRHILLYPFAERIIGDGYKFADYYSSYDLNDEYSDINKDIWPTPAQIEESYKVKPELVEMKKDRIFTVFPRL